MKYLVTGGTGYVGTHVVRALINRGHEVVIAGRGEREGIHPSAQFLKLDVLETDEDIFVNTGSPDILIHLAWEDGFNHTSPKHFDNLPRHLAFLRNMLRGGLRHIVGVGTVHEIGFHVGPIDEHTPTFPQHAYGVAKNFLRAAQSILCKEFGATDQWLRCFYIFGDDHLNNSIFTKLLAAAKDGKTEFPLNSGELLFDFVEVDELASMIADVASQREITGIINCCTGEPISLKTMVSRFIDKNNLNIEPKWGEFPLRPYDSRAIWGDTKKLRAIRSVMQSEVS